MNVRHCLLVAIAAIQPLAAQRIPARPLSMPAANPTDAPAGWVKEFGTMWTFDAPPLAYWKARYAFTPDQAWLDHVRLASVRIPGCSASIVSANGLVMTNHHCGRECTAAASSADSNYIQTGFAAGTLTDEKKCPMLWADQLISIQDVTARVQGSMTAATAAAKVQQRALEIDRLQKECAKDATTLCEVVTFYQGGRYSLYTYHHFSDVRLVMAPEGDIAFYGGDPDNFTYPRYDLDLTLLRIYDNGQPLHARDYLKWSAAGASEGELVFVTGNPGSTGRLLTLAQMEYLRDVDYPNRLAGYDRMLKAFRAASAASPDAQRRYQNLIFSYENSKKAVTGYRVGLVDSSIMAKKRAFERDFRRRIDADPALKAKYGATWDSIAAAERAQTALAPQLLWPSFGGGSNLLNWAGIIVRMPGQIALPDSLRLATFRGSAPQRLRQAIDTTTVDTTFERAVLAGTLAAWKASLPATNPILAAALAYGNGDPDSAAAAIVAQT
ncbi:MAG TPA: S46 family peptidase, partial [Gemmatimonadaceae bacterium]